MRIIVSRKYTSLSGSVMMVGTGFKGPLPNVLFLEKGNLQLKVGQPEEQEAGFLSTLFPVDCVFFFFIALVAYSLFPWFPSSPGLFPLHTKLFSATSFFLKRAIICSITVLLGFDRTWWPGRVVLLFQGSKERGNWAGREETDCFRGRMLLLPLWSKKDKVV